MNYTFGPVPSRRLGQSIGVNNIPPKYCTYACVYCQLGDPQHVSTRRQRFYDAEAIVAEVRDVLFAQSSTLDYVTIVPDGEPTLDASIEPLLEGIRTALDEYNGGDPMRSVRLALITNGSQITEPDVARGIQYTDWVSVKIDAPTEEIWRRIDRPARDLDFHTILDRFTAFRPSYHGVFATETMLVDGVNTDNETLSSIAGKIAELSPDVAYLSIPTRPPAEPWVNAPDESTVLEAYRIFREADIPVELNVGHESGEFSVIGDLGEGILAIAAVHPIRIDDLEDLVRRREGSWTTVEGLVQTGRLLEKRYRDETFYVTRLSRHRTK